MINTKRVTLGAVVGLVVGGLTYHYLTLRMNNVTWCGDCESYATVIHVREMLESVSASLVSFLITTKASSLWNKKERK